MTLERVKCGDTKSLQEVWEGGKNGCSSKDFEVREFVLYDNRNILIHRLNAMEHCSTKAVVTNVNSGPY